MLAVARRVYPSAPARLTMKLNLKKNTIRKRRAEQKRMGN